ncbi:hypothetical protein [Marinifilum flexuosum]|uniref:SIR2-like protein n=1 Tax=Marinifilum flexuosum TaxID=1117708 RepID=A0A419XAB0_9BACT|nr:hypothetical protein [Marinifilum flexuosum]RKE04698.1 hypothetical protein BXY64_1725 [Marinifilum flexuosum]
MTGLKREDRINTVYGGGGHVVILGAGASIASTLRNPELSGKKLPSMDNFIELVGLEDILESIDDRFKAKNFETLYSNLHRDDPNSTAIKEIERRVISYFKDMRLPEEPTIYDLLVLSLRPRDLIATFNWDPFLYQAFCRNSKFTKDLPLMSFLHGNVSIGYSYEDKRCGLAGMYMRRDGGFFEPTKLLYPVHEKNYNQDEFISTEWDRLKFWLGEKSTKLVTVFGYGAPESDVEAVRLLDEAYGGKDARNMEQFEVIDVQDEDVVVNRWDKFIHSHHYDYATSYFESSLARNPRRTSENYFQHVLPTTIAEAFSESNPIPSDFSTMKELWEWHRPLIEAEEKWKEKQLMNK